MVTYVMESFGLSAINKFKEVYMRKWFFAVVLIVIALGFFSTFSVISKESVEKSAPQNIVIKVSHGTDDLHAVLMALKISKMLNMKGQDTTLFFNLESVRLLDNRSNFNLAWGHTENIGKVHDEAVKAGVEVMLCPHCAEVAGIGAKNPRAGAALATENDMADMFIKADKVIDY
jgi:predicted peroxiredoxin